MRKAIMVLAGAVASATLGGCATTASEPSGTQSILESVLGGQPRVGGADLRRRIDAAQRHPLGSRENPVRAHLPQGQQAYLSRLRCADGRAPQFARRGNIGVGVFGNIVDDYDVRCVGSSPASATIIMDLYHPGYVEQRPVIGFTIVR